MEKYILALDQGTTSSRALVVNSSGQVISSTQQEFQQIYPQNGWVEHVPTDIWQTTLTCCQKALAQATVEVSAISICNQRETTVVWDKTTGEPVYNAIVWQDRRTASYCDELKCQGYEAQIQHKTGLLLDPYFSASKINWLLSHVPQAKQLADQGKLAFGTIDSYLIWQLTQGQNHCTDVTNASRTSLFNIHSLNWDQELLSLFDIPASILPEVKQSADDFGICNLFDYPIPINGVLGDQQAALVGQNCFESGEAKSTYGTGCFLMLNTGSKPILSSGKLLSTIAYQLNGHTAYALEGSSFIAGAAVQWLRDGIKCISSAKETEKIAQSIAYDHGVFIVPSFTGLGAPYWQANARGAIFGLTRDSTNANLIAASLQSIAYQTRDLVEAMQQDGIQLDSIKVDGGMANNHWAMQFLAEILQVSLVKPTNTETSAVGAAFMAMLQQNIHSDFAQISALYQSSAHFTPKVTRVEANKLYQKWQQAVQATLVFSDC
ncbi:glycerol kinase GlpK [Catenovulum agarivorans]|uniref:glycerol kinase GlpK n=1 Tax=Catenovulum agarivorans TaxID=1172192 RepID=UPI0002E52213|nr:glycerol kinase GlpK [Catenovulum agarivorans]